MLEFIKKLAWDCGEICLQDGANLSEDDVDFKGKRDLVTAVDKKVEDFLVAAIGEKYPHHDILGEETGLNSRGSDHRWVVDPIDGTTSFCHGQPYYSISIAYQVQGKTEAAVVYGPSLGQMFSAERGKGSFLNGSKIQVSATSELINSVFATGFACLRAGREVNNLYHLNNVLPNIRDIRRCGSAALDLAYVAAGKCDGFWEMDLNSYDVAAGVLLVEEAGGDVFDMKGKNNYPEDGIVAGNGKITAQLISLLQK